MLGNYKVASVRDKLQGLHAWNTVPIHALHIQEMSISDSCLELYLRHFCFPSHFLLFFLLIHLFCQSPSVCPSPSFPLLCAGMFVSAVSDESVVSRALLCACVCVFMVHVCTCSLQKRDRGGRPSGQEKKETHLDRLEHFHWELPTQNLGG